MRNYRGNVALTFEFFFIFGIYREKIVNRCNYYNRRKTFAVSNNSNTRRIVYE